jgi:hypothetical protein
MKITANFFFSSIFTLMTMGIGRMRIMTSAMTSVNYQLCQLCIPRLGSRARDEAFRYTYQKSQKHRHCFDAIVVVIGFDEDGDRITGKEMRYREADGPANHKRKYCINNDLKFSHSENILVHDQN